MNTKTRMASTVKFVNNDLAAKLTSTLPRWPAKQWQSFGSSNGADVILSTENGIKVAFHKVIVERFTNIFDALESANIEELRDPFGSLVIILPGVEYETLQALSHLLYAGECHVNFMGGREALEAILDPSVKEKVTGHSWLSPALKDEPVAEPPTTTVPEQEVTEVQDGDEESPQLTDEPAEDQNVSFRLNLSDDSDEDECSTDELVNIEVEEGPSTDRLESVEEGSSEGNWDDERRADTSDEVENGDSESQSSESDADYSDTESLEEEVANENIKGHNSKKPNKHHSKKVSDPKKKPHRCELCNKGFLYKSGLEEHQIVHSGEKPHQCKYCGKHFGYKSHLNRHERFHTGEKPHQCKYCGKHFGHKGHLNRHERFHTGETPFKCTYCDKRFMRGDDCKRHERTHTTKSEANKHKSTHNNDKG